VADQTPPVNSSFDPRAALYAECWKAYYDAFYSHLLADLIAGRWQKLDQISKLLVALFSTSSAIAGWSIWTANVGGQYIWAGCAGFATFLSIVQTSLAVSDRLKTMLESRGRMLRIKLEFETLFSSMRLNAAFDIAPVKERFEALQKEYNEAASQMPKDWIYTKRDAREVEETLKEMLATTPV
jgi:hypothetical protein